MAIALTGLDKAEKSRTTLLGSALMEDVDETVAISCLLLMLLLLLEAAAASAPPQHPDVTSDKLPRYSLSPLLLTDSNLAIESWSDVIKIPTPFD